LKEGFLEILSSFKIWKKKWVTLKGGVLFFAEAKGKQREGKFPLYRCKFEEYQPNSYNFAFQITAAGQQVVIRAPTEQDMHIVSVIIVEVLICKVVKWNSKSKA
jgi:hypothetical protein